MVTPRWMVLGSIALAAYVMTPLSASAGYPSCPSGGAPLDLVVDNETGSPAAVTFTGAEAQTGCSGGGVSSYTYTATCAVGVHTCATVTGIQPGMWRHQISVGSQQQGTQSVLIGGDPGGINNKVSWTAFRSVITVNNIGDGAGNCSQPGQCTLRQAIITANSSPTPALVQFDPTVFPGSQTTVTLSNSASLTIGSGVMVDGTDLNGNPAMVGQPYASPTPVFNRVVELPSSGSSFVFSGQLATLAGLFVQRPAQATGATPGVPVFFNTSSTQNTVVNVKIDGGGSSVTDKSSGQDCISAGYFGAAGTSFANANIVTNCEIQYCLDKGVKSAYGSYTKVQNSWVYRSIGGGIQATLSGNIEADHNVVERVGSNSSSVVYPSANGFSSHGASATPGAGPSLLNTHGNLSRINALRGLTADASAANASINNDFACGNMNGNSILAGAGGPTSATSTITVRGSTFVYNSSDGAVVGDSQSSGNFGTSCTTDPGNNVFTQNTGYDFENDSSYTMQSVCNQWQGCPTNSSCSPRTFQHPGSVNYSPWEPYEVINPSIASQGGFYPTKAWIGDIVHIIGSGLNAVDSYRSGGACSTNFNSCGSGGNGSGVCVTLSIPGSTTTIEPHVWSVTPTDIAFQMPTVGCTQPVTVSVTQTGSSFTATGTFCTNE